MPPGATAALLVSCALCVGTPAGAAHRLSVAVSPQFQQLRDDLLPPARFVGPGGALALGYHHERAEGFAEVLVQGTFAGFSDRFTGTGRGWGPTGGLAVMGQAQQRLWTWGNFSLQGGATLHAAETLWVVRNWDDAHAYWLTDYDLGPVMRGRWQVGSAHTVWAQVNLPLVSLVGRPPMTRNTLLGALRVPAFYIVATHARMQLMTLDQLFALHAEAAWRVEVDSRWAVQAGYALDFTSITQPAWLRMLNQSVHARVLYAL